MRILVAEEDGRLAGGIAALLEGKGFEVEAVACCEEGARYAALGAHDLVVLGAGERERCALEVLRGLRRGRCAVPLVLLSSAGGAGGRAAALNAGADYCLQKPVDFGELEACIGALLRRGMLQGCCLALGNTLLDTERSMLLCGGKSVQLTARELGVMRLLMQSQGRLLPKEAILARVWGYDSNAVENHVEVYVGFLRKKLKALGSDIRICAERRLGYRTEAGRA